MGKGNREGNMMDELRKVETIHVEMNPEGQFMDHQPKWQSFQPPVYEGDKHTIKKQRSERLRTHYKQMSQEDLQELRNKTEYVHEKIENENDLYFAKAVKGHQLTHINQAIITVMGKGIYDKAKAMRMSEDERDRTATLHHARGTKLLAEGKTVLKFDLAGSSYKQWRKDQNGFLGKEHLEDTDEEFNEKFQKLMKEFKRVSEELAHQQAGGQVDEQLQAEYDDLQAKIRKLQSQIDTKNQYGERGLESDKEKKYVMKKTDHTGKKVSYSIAGAQKLLNQGDYSIEHVVQYFLETAQNELNPIFRQWAKDKKEGPDIHLIIRGHSRGGVAAIRGAMKLQKWLNDTWGDYAKYVKFELTQYDPVAGAGSNYGTYSELDLQGSEEELANHGMAPLKNAETTLIYSIHTDKWYGGFRPQIVKGAKRVILTPFKHSTGLDQIDESQVRELRTEDGKVLKTKEKAHKIGFTDLRTGEVYRQSGISELEEGLYILDQSNNLVKMNNYKDTEAILNLALKHTVTQEMRHDIIKDVAKAWFNERAETVTEQEQSEHEELKSQMYKVLFDEKRSIFHSKKDSSQMTSVKQSITKVNGLLEGAVTRSSLNLLTKAYDELLKACAVYTNRMTFTPLGIARKRMVKTLQIRSEAELNFLRNISSERIKEYQQDGRSWDYILREARTAKISKIPKMEQDRLKNLEDDGACELQRGNNTYLFQKENELFVRENSARKNVAARSLSELLGVQDMFAQSKLAEFELPKQAGQTAPGMVRGILTKIEQGKTMDDVRKEAKEKNLKLVYSDTANKQLTQLRLMDLLMGYVGRSEKEYLARTEYGETLDGEPCLRVTGLMVHENAVVTFTNRSLWSMNEEDQQLTDVTGALRPEYVDRTFLNKLQFLSDALIDMNLRHVLTDRERRHLKNRLHALRQIWQDHPVLVGSISRRRG